ncbi:hypothetical protein V9K67_13615 [Paraflavisolibacter sp. H34]|uniref:hypothetical protein n=1 Tax=Huijunlia imazamoxiresistens TaxID=3127457 RepID=UPI00301618D1
MKAQFTKLVKAGNRLREFNFRKLPSAENNLFHVDISDDRGNRIIFKMRKNANEPWKIIDENLPPWIYEVEGKLNEVMEEQN